MYWLSVLIFGIIVLLFEIFTFRNFLRAVLFGFIPIIVTVLVVYIDYQNQVTDYEVWSGHVDGWEHIEEWDEWIPPVTTCSTDSEGKKTCSTTPGYWEHHDAENYIHTTDGGSIYVSEGTDGKKFNDRWPNDDEVLKEYWSYGTPSASKHKYENKINASYSIYKHGDINLEDFPNLPDYPIKVRDKINVDRLIGNFENYDELNKILSLENTRLNSEEIKKQVNLIFVNLGNNSDESYGFALQDHWQGGNKNDFIVSFSTDNKGNIEGVYPFSWSESELLKINVRELFLDDKNISDMESLVVDVSKMVESDFVRKEFSDFDYLQINTTFTAKLIIWILNFTLIILYFILSYYMEGKNTTYKRRYKY